MAIQDLTKRKPFILLVRFSTLGCRQNEEKKEKENGRKDYVKLVEATVEVQGIWPQSVAWAPLYNKQGIVGYRIVKS